MNDIHLIREAQQIKLLSESIVKIIESSNDKTKSQHELNHEIGEIDHLNNITKNFLEVVFIDKTINHEFLTKINHELRIPLTSALTYTEMLLDSKYGPISNEQRKRLEIINSSTRELVQTIQNLSSEKSHDVALDKSEVSKNHEINELEQEKKILDGINVTLSDELEKTRKEKAEIERDLKDSYHKIREIEQEKIFASKDAQEEQEKNRLLQKKHILTLSLILGIVAIGFVGYSYYENQVIIKVTARDMSNYNSNYIIQNLQGDTVNTWVSWNIENGRTIHVHVVNNANLPQDRINAVENAIVSTKAVSIDNSQTGKGSKGSSIYYVGWEGAAADAYSEPTKLYIPQKFDINGSPDGVGDVEIILTNDVNPDGYSGFTKSLVDGNQILKSKITIYKANKLDAGNLEAIVRHEFGHAMGLGHSTAQEDLMHPILPDYPYISSCDVDALKGLYNGDKNSQVVCKK